VEQLATVGVVGDVLGRYRAAVAADADMASVALAWTWQRLVRALPGGWVARDGGAVASLMPSRRAI
jgi:hypothetical protein